MKYETIGGLPTQGMVYLQMMDLLRQLQDSTALAAHLARANGDDLLADRWLGAHETFRMYQNVIQHLVTKGAKQ
jgi:hypothetical protein